MTAPDRALRLFEGFGVEIEYMIVRSDTLDVAPVADRLLAAAAPDAEVATEVERGAIAWSNELVLHVLELKTAGPAPSLGNLSALFHEQVLQASRWLEPLGCRLLPGGAHPWMDPFLETRLWPHEYNEVYRTFDRIFGCKGHGWANLQSCHLNLPFRGDREFGALHAAIRVLLPLLPALAAASPVLDGRVEPALDARLVAYRSNSRRIPSVAGLVVPDPVSSRREYEERILSPIYRDLASLDPQGVLRHEWVNARGLIPHFRRGSLEIRVLDSQECPSADLAIVRLVCRTLRWMVERTLADPVPWNALETEALADLLDRCIVEGEAATVDPAALVTLLDLDVGARPCAGEVWRALARRDEDMDADPREREALRVILEEGPLARRILRGLGTGVGTPVDRGRLRQVWGELAECLTRNVPYRPTEG